MNPNQDESRCYDGFSVLDGGLDSGWDASLLDKNQYAFGINVSIRGGNISTRNGMNQRMLLFDSQTTQNNYSGRFQGAMGFSSPQSDSSGIILSVSGRLFRIWIDKNFLVTEITPQLLVMTISDIILPSPGGSITVDVNDTSKLNSGDTIIIGPSTFTITSIGTDQLILTYVSGSQTGNVATTASVTIPSGSGVYAVPVNSPSSFTVAQTIKISGNTFTIAGIGADSISINYTLDSPLTIQSGTGIQDSGGAQIIYTLPIPPGSAILDSLGNEIFVIRIDNVNADYVDMFQGDDYSLFTCENKTTIFFDGASAFLSDISKSQIPSGSLGTFAWGRNWVAQVDRQTFIASDLTGDPSGTPDKIFKDAVLFVTENNLLNGGGSFSIPAQSGQITAMTSLSELDTSLGIGPVLVGTNQRVYSVQAPVDRTTWQNLSYPIQSVAVDGAGPVGPNNHCKTNSDWWFRSLDGYRSFIAARQDFGYNDGKTPQSFEISRILEKDNQNFLFFGSMINFSNRIIATVSPQITSHGIIHKGLVTQNLDPISTMRQRQKPAWESLNTGLEALRLVSVNDNGTVRGFILALNGSNGIDLWELSDSENDTDDVLSSGPSYSRTGYTQIQSVIETRAMDFGDSTTQKKGITAELYLDEISDEVKIKLYLRPDQYPDWVLWDTQTICSNNRQCVFPVSCELFVQNNPQYAARIMFKRPPENTNTITGKPMDRFYQLQCRMEITGSCKIRIFKVHAKWERQKMEGDAPKDSGCTTVAFCDKPWYSYSSYGQ